MAGNKNSGRKEKEGGVRTSILIDAEVYNYLARNNNISAEVERVAREDMGTYADSGKVTLTRRSKLGWDYSTYVTNNGIDVPNKPYYVGTYNKVRASISADRSFSSLGGAYYNAAWFVRISGQWRRIIDGDPSDLVYFEKVEVTIE